MLPKLSVASDLVYSSRQTVPHTRSCDSKSSVAERGTCAWNSEFAAVAHAGTDRQTDARQMHRPCCAYYAGGARSSRHEYSDNINRQLPLSETHSQTHFSR